MELEAVIAQRRSIRKFETKPVEKVKLEKLIEAARLCQSAKNRQPWQFMILEDGRKDQVAEIMLQLFESHDEELPGFVNSSRHTAQIIKNAPVLMLVFREPDELWTPGDLLSIGAASCSWSPRSHWAIRLNTPLRARGNPPKRFCFRFKDGNSSFFIFPVRPGMI